MSDKPVEVHALACDWPGCDVVSDNFDSQYGDTYREAVENYTDTGIFLQEWIHVEPDKDYCYKHFYRSDDGTLVPGPRDMRTGRKKQ